MRMDREWMYCRLEDGLLNKEFMDGIDKFIDFACSHPECMDCDKIKCPCNFWKCQNRRYYDVNTVRFHLQKYGFVSDYHDWILHGETSGMLHENQNVHDVSQDYSVEDTATSNAYHAMVINAAGPNSFLNIWRNLRILRLSYYMTCWMMQIKKCSLVIRTIKNYQQLREC